MVCLVTSACPFRFDFLLLLRHVGHDGIVLFVPLVLVPLVGEDAVEGVSPLASGTAVDGLVAAAAATASAATGDASQKEHHGGGNEKRDGKFGRGDLAAHLAAGSVARHGRFQVDLARTQHVAGIRILQFEVPDTGEAGVEPSVGGAHGGKRERGVEDVRAVFGTDLVVHGREVTIGTQRHRCLVDQTDVVIQTVQGDRCRQQRALDTVRFDTVVRHCVVGRENKVLEVCVRQKAN